MDVFIAAELIIIFVLGFITGRFWRK